MPVSPQHGMPLPAQPSPGARARRWTLGRAAGPAAVVLAEVALFVAILWPNDEARIRQVTEDFSVAVGTVDQAKIHGLLCREEADNFVNSDGYDPAARSGALRPESQVAAATASDIHIVGDVASARVIRKAKRPTTLYFRKENGDWKVCASVADQITSTHQH